MEEERQRRKLEEERRKAEAAAKEKARRRASLPRATTIQDTSDTTQQYSARSQASYQATTPKNVSRTPPPVHKPMTKPKMAKKRKPSIPVPDEPEEDAMPTSNANDYLVMAQNAEDASPQKLHLIPCDICGRKFAADRLDKHRNACVKASQKKRKVFDATKMRTDGTEAEQFVKHRPPSPKVQKVS